MSSHPRVLQILLARVAVALVLTVSLLTSACGADTAKFPPYPDEWEWFVPSDANAHLTNLSAFLLDDGEVLVTAELRDDEGKSNNRSWLLFSKRRVDGTSIDETGRAMARGEAVGQVVGTGKVEASIGSGLSVTSVSRGYRLCFRGPVRNIVVKRDSLGHVVSSRVVFVVLNQAREFVGGGGQASLGEEGASCPDEGPVRVRYQVAAVAGTFLSLPDETTLMIDRETGVIVRLRNTLELGRPSPSGRVYSFEYRDNDFFIDDVLGKHYSSDGETPRYQEMVDDLYNYLTQQTRKRSAVAEPIQTIHTFQSSPEHTEISRGMATYDCRARARSYGRSRHVCSSADCPVDWTEARCSCRCAGNAAVRRNSARPAYGAWVCALSIQRVVSDRIDAAVNT